LVEQADAHAGDLRDAVASTSASTVARGWDANYARSLSEGDFEQPIDFVFINGKATRMTRGEMTLHVACLAEAMQAPFCN
jgi:hypothetical protein